MHQYEQLFEEYSLNSKEKLTIHKLQEKKSYFYNYICYTKFSEKQTLKVNISKNSTTLYKYVS